MVIGKKEFRRLAVSMGVARSKEVSLFFEEFPKDTYDDDSDIVLLWRRAQTYSRWAQCKRTSGLATYKKLFI